MLRAGLVSKKDFVATTLRFLQRAACATLVCAMVFHAKSWAIGPWQQIQELTGQPTTYDFGTAVAMSSDGSTMVVGTPGWGAFVFINNGTTWTQQQELTTPADAAGYAFGASVAVSNNGSTIVVGAYDPLNCPDGGEDGCTGGNPGKAYVFVKSGTTWTQQQELTASDGAMQDNFGSSVAVSANGGTIIIGAPGAGKVYVFLSNGSTWTQQQELTASDAASYFGTLVAVSGDGGTVLISDYPLGKVYVFVNNGSAWVQQQELTVSDGSDFGESLAVSYNGSIVVSGANPSSLGNSTAKGKAYVFVGNGTTWTQQQELTAFDGTGGSVVCCVGDDGFGESVSLCSDGSVLLLGAPNATTVGSNLYQGKAYIFVGNGTTWTQQQELIDSNGALGDGFGSAVSISGNGVTASVGEPGFNAGQGDVYVFNAIAGSSATTTTVLNTSANPSTSGQSVTFTVDVFGYSPTGTVTFTDNGSNLATVPLVNWQAAYTTAYSTPGAHAITAVYSGDGNNQPSTSAGLIQDVDMPWLQLQELTGSDPTVAAFGSSVAIDGNTAVVGAPSSNSSEGEAYVFVQNNGMWNQQAELTVPAGVGGGRFGSSVAISGNTAVVGAEEYDAGNGNGSTGAAFVFVQSGGTWTQQALLLPPNAVGVQNNYFGWSVAISGNTIVVGAPYTYTSSGEGVTYVYVQSGGTWTLQTELPAPGHSVAISGNTIVSAGQGGPPYVYTQSGGTWSQQATLIDSNGADDDFGWSVAIDGSTAVVGARQYRTDSNSYQAVAYAFVQNAGTWSQQAAFAAPDAQGSDTNEMIGAEFVAVAISGSTAVMAAPLPTNQQGTAYAFTQGGGTWGQPAALIASDLADATSDQFGYSVAISGNTAMVGAPEEAFGPNSQELGAVYVFAPPVVTLAGSPQQPLTTDGSGNFIAQVTITNTGNVTVSSIQVTSATLGSGSLLSTPAAITNLAPGQSAVVTLTFPPSSVATGAPKASLKLNGTYSVTSPLLSGNWALSFRSVTL